MKKFLCITLIIIFAFCSGFFVRGFLLDTENAGSDNLDAAGVYHTSDWGGKGARSLILHPDGTCEYPDRGHNAVGWVQQDNLIVFTISLKETGELIMTRSGYLVDDGLVLEDALFFKK